MANVLRQLMQFGLTLQFFTGKSLSRKDVSRKKVHYHLGHHAMTTSGAASTAMSWSMESYITDAII